MEENIPELEVVENKVILPTLEVPIIFNKEKKMIKFRKLTAGDRRNILKKHIATSIRGTQVNSQIEDVLGIQIMQLTKIIVEAPFDFTEKGLSELPEEIIDYLYSEYEEWTKKKVTSEDSSKNTGKE